MIFDLKLFIYKYKKLIFFSIIFLIIGNISNAVLPFYIGYLIDNLNSITFIRDIDKSFVYIILFIFLGHIFLYIGNLLLSIALPRIIYDIRKKIFIKILDLPVNYFIKTKEGKILNKVIIDIDYLLNSLQQIFINFFTLFFNLIVLLVCIFNFFPICSILLVLIILIIFIIFIYFFIFMLNNYKKFYIYIEKLNSFVSECYSNIEIIKVENLFENKFVHFQYINNNLKKICYKINFLSFVFSPIINIFIYLFIIFIIFYGSYCYVFNKEFFNSIITLGILQAYIQLLFKINTNISQLIDIFPHFQYIYFSTENIFSFLNIDIAKTNNINFEKNNNETNSKYHIIFDNVTFINENKIIFDNFNIKIKKGEKIALLGKTGCGKTTVSNLLLKIDKPNSGNIFINNNNINNYSEEQLYEKIGVIFQEPWVFSGNIFENIKFGDKNIKNKDIIFLCKYLGIDNIINKLENKYNTIIGMDYNNISQSEKQLICIARVLIRKPKILIMDEFNSCIDFKTEKEISDNIINYLNENRITTIIIAHKLKILKELDKVYKFENCLIK